ncbi:MAG TPA: hypothetical protein VFW63_03375 [Acidimicrobiales bacterium]|nr:hypothetical protein [Acidimicrobiales bacterium]
MLRRRRAPADRLAQVDPALVSPRFAGAVAGALDARRRYADVVAGVADGPVRDRLAEAGARVDAGVAGVWEIARRATQVEATLAALDPERVTDEYKRARREGADPELETALAQRFASVQRLLNALDDTEARLRQLDAGLGAAVAGAAEVALGVTPPERLGAELDGVVGELGALRGALDELA